MGERACGRQTFCPRVVVKKNTGSAGVWCLTLWVNYLNYIYEALSLHPGTAKVLHIYDHNNAALETVRAVSGRNKQHPTVGMTGIQREEYETGPQTHQDNQTTAGLSYKQRRRQQKYAKYRKQRREEERTHQAPY